ncbi:NUDIX domain-containing protein [Cohnella zeiphila]|uniref:NUDIX hydrolase n=1 Tax=Cohnella zeiphila TaxID=2761120 RepID=A0A7X0SKG6_9BACL|nr:NUDIX hydrolase [Cohnella zeiphila]MBB6730469.1 NUDIX hydrolase [Cohnella zeiphila]
MSESDATKHPFYEETVSSQPIYGGRIISLQVDTVKLPDGETATREIVKHPGAVAVIAMLEDRMLVVEQFRKALERAQVEIPAGKLEPGEDPMEAAGRELEEETGYRARTIRHLRSFSTSPGFADEVIHLYLAEDLERGEVRLDDEEFLTCEAITAEQADDYLASGKIFDAKTVLAVSLWRNRTLTGQWRA